MEKNQKNNITTSILQALIIANSNERGEFKKNDDALIKRAIFLANKLENYLEKEK